MAQSMALLFEKCDNSTYTGPGFCKSEEEITEWIKRKFIVVAMNQERFGTREYAYDKKVTKEVQYHYVPINSQIREEIVYKVQLTDLRLQDSYFKFSQLTEDDRRIFSSHHVKNRPYEFPDNVQMQVTFEFDLNLSNVGKCS